MADGLDYYATAKIKDNTFVPRISRLFSDIRSVQSYQTSYYENQESNPPSVDFNQTRISISEDA